MSTRSKNKKVIISVDKSDMKRKLTAQVIKEDKGYSASIKINDSVIFAEGDSLEGLKSDLESALNLTFEGKYSLEDMVFEFDLDSLFHFYKIINAKALSERIGMNQSLLAQYIKGIKTPSARQKERIINAINDLGKELSEVNLILERI